MKLSEFNDLLYNNTGLSLRSEDVIKFGKRGDILWWIPSYEIQVDWAGNTKGEIIRWVNFKEQSPFVGYGVHTEWIGEQPFKI